MANPIKNPRTLLSGFFFHFRFRVSTGLNCYKNNSKKRQNVDKKYLKR
jgi:hypothetical protein